jgi:RNA polymerase sigma-70 factor (ECF subfamily)
VLKDEKSPSAPLSPESAAGPSPLTRDRFEAVALPHLDSVYRMARALGSDAAEADDLVQETFTRAYRAFDRFELHEYGAKPWLLRILQNVFYTAKGKQRRQPRLLEDIDLSHFVDELNWSECVPVSVGGLDWDHFDEELKSAVAHLQPEYRIVLLLWSIEGLSYREIADLCECALGTVMSRLYRARRTVGRRLREYARERKLDTARFE